MAFFGSFETDREIYSDPIYTVYGAKKPGDQTSEYAVKVFSIHQVGLEAETTMDLEPLLSEIERTRLKGIELQAKAAANSVNIAPVLESGGMIAEFGTSRAFTRDRSTRLSAAGWRSPGRPCTILSGRLPKGHSTSNALVGVLTGKSSPRTSRSVKASG